MIDPTLAALLIEQADAGAVRVGSLPLEANIEAQRRWDRAVSNVDAWTTAHRAELTPEGRAAREVESLIDDAIRAAWVAGHASGSDEYSGEEEQTKQCEADDASDALRAALGLDDARAKGEG